MWGLASDNIGVTQYRVLVNNEVIKIVDKDTYRTTITGLSSDTNYLFTVEAGDEMGNWSVNNPSKYKTTNECGNNENNSEINLTNMCTFENFASYEIVPNNGESEEGVWTILDKDCNLYDQNMIVCSANQCAIGKPFSVAINKVVVWLDQECSRSGIGGYYNPETRKLYFDDGFTCNGGSA